MPPNMHDNIRRLATTFIVFFLALSGVAAYIQIGNRPVLGDQVLAHGQYDTSDQRNCPPYNSSIRGTIFDRNGVKLAWTQADPKAPCGYRRAYDPRVATSGLASLLGYYSPRYGTAGIEHTYNDVLAGVQTGETITDVENHLLHKPLYGNNIYLTIDINLQVQANKNYDSSAVYGGSVCQPRNSNPPSGGPAGSLIVENPNTGEILAMVSRPSYDPNLIDTGDYFQQLSANPLAPLVNHATQGLYDPGSTFKTVTLLAALDSGKASLSGTTFNEQDAVHYVVNGEHIDWVDYLAPNGWSQVHAQFAAGQPLTLGQAYAYSDNTVFAREAVTLGADTWLGYVRKFGIATPGTDVPSVHFDAPYRQSSAYNAITNHQPTQFNSNLLAESGFGQGQLFITPLTMTEITSTVASGGTLYDPYTVGKVVTHDGTTSYPNTPTAYGDGPIVRPETTAAVRQAMWMVTSIGTAAFTGNPTSGASYHNLANSPVKEGGKTGTAQLDAGDPVTWWISLAPDDAAPGGGPAQLVSVISKEHSGEGACQVWVTDNTYLYAQQQHIGPYAKP